MSSESGTCVSVPGLVHCLWTFVGLFSAKGTYFSAKPPFLTDLPLEGPFENFNAYMAGVNQGYKNNAFNCLIAACLYLVTMAICGWQFYMNTLSSGPASGGAV
ncbi:unnamed protein product, partial [Meganyctiphanes norvegica]